MREAAWRFDVCRRTQKRHWLINNINRLLNQPPTSSSTSTSCWLNVIIWQEMCKLDAQCFYTDAVHFETVSNVNFLRLLFKLLAIFWFLFASISHGRVNATGDCTTPFPNRIQINSKLIRNRWIDVNLTLRRVDFVVFINNGVLQPHYSELPNPFEVKLRRKSHQIDANSLKLIRKRWNWQPTSQLTLI